MQKLFSFVLIFSFICLAQESSASTATATSDSHVICQQSGAGVYSCEKVSKGQSLGGRCFAQEYTTLDSCLFVKGSM